MLKTRICLICLARTWLIGAAMTTRGMQHIGLLYALNPGLEAIYPDPEDLVSARLRYSEHVNTHPFMAPLFTGILLALEQQIAQGTMPCEHSKAIKDTTATTLSALGDSFFSGTVLVFWAFSTILLLQMNCTKLAIGWSALFFVAQTAFRIASFFLGVRQGLFALNTLRRMDLINWGDMLKLVNALLLGLLVWRLFPTASPHDLWGSFGAGLACLTAGTLMVGRAHMPRIFLPFLILGLVALGTLL